MAIVKYLVGEIEGVEDCEGTERVLDAKDVRVEPAISGFTDVDSVLRGVVAGDPFLNALFDKCTPLFDHDETTGQVVLLEECNG